MSFRDWTQVRPGRYGDTAVWKIDIAGAASQWEACLSTLSEDERNRAGKFLRTEDRMRFAISHAALRSILAAELGTHPKEVGFDVDTSGKPQLTGRFRGRLTFNLSHSGGAALVAVAPRARIGVDVEAVRAVGDCLRIAQAHFAPSETRALARLSGEALTNAFFACWTRKEAFVKALGTGLSGGLDHFTVSIPPARAALLDIDGDTDRARAWSLIAIDPDPYHAASVAIDEPDATCALRSLAPDWFG